MQKTAIITGGTKGIGKALIIDFVKLGFSILTCARSKKDIQDLEEEFSQTSQVKGIALDLGIKENCYQFVEFVISNTKKVDCLVNNAGIFKPGRIHEEDDSIFELTMKVNLNSSYYITKGLLPLIIANGGGHIFNMCSTASIMAYPNGGSYCISKFALLGFSKVLREEMKEKKVKVTSVIPGATFTPSWSESGLPESRFMKPSDVAASIISAYQISDRSVVEELIIRPQLGDI